MIGQICKVCNKVIFPYTRKIYLSKDIDRFEKLAIASSYYNPILYEVIERSPPYLVVIVKNPKLYSTGICSEECKEKLKTAKRQRNKVAEGTPLKKQILERYGRKCAKCGTQENLEIHHLKPVLSGGETQKENLILLCKRCHKATHRCRYHKA
jgi:hypothetical protein